MIRRLFCWMGFHAWREFPTFTTRHLRCVYCSWKRKLSV